MAAFFTPEVIAALAALTVAVCAALVRRLEKPAAEARSRRRERARIAEKTGDLDLLDDTITGIKRYEKGGKPNGRQ